MEYGLHFGTRRVAGTPEWIREVSTHCENLGFRHFGLSDHIVIPKTIESRYEYHESGNHPTTGSGFCLDLLTTLTFVAAVTNRIRLLTSVMVLPYRPALLTAKMLATADILSKGRITAGVGVGWMEEEMIALQTPSFKNRGKVSDEFIAAFRDLWYSADPRTETEKVNCKKLFFEPRAIQTPLPIGIGGEGPAARKRAGRIGDGWYPVAKTFSIDLDTPSLLKEGIQEVRDHAESSDRNPDTLEMALYVPWYKVGEPRKRKDGSRLRFTGSTEDIIQDVCEFEEVGLQHLVIGFETEIIADAKERISQFSEQIAGKITSIRS